MRGCDQDFDVVAALSVELMPWYQLGISYYPHLFNRVQHLVSRFLAYPLPIGQANTSG